MLIYSPLLAAWWRMAIATVTVIWVSPGVTVQFFFLHSCVLKRCSLPIFQAKPNFSKTLQSLLMRLAIFVNTVLQLNLRVWSKLNKSVTKHLVPSGMSV